MPLRALYWTGGGESQGDPRIPYPPPFPAPTSVLQVAESRLHLLVELGEGSCDVGFAILHRVLGTWWHHPLHLPNGGHSPPTLTLNFMALSL